jgi:hypothetical protein
MIMNTKIKILFFLLITSFVTNAQIDTRSINDGIFGGNINFDASGGFLDNSGMLYARTNLTSFTFSGTDDQGYDGLVVYNTTAGNTQATGAGVGNEAVTKGFYYFDNPNGSSFGLPTSAGVWTPLGGGSSSAVAIADGVASDSYATINATQEKVVRLTGISADGTNTTLDLDAALTTAGVAVAKFRKAAIYDTAGDLVMQATGGYTTGTDILVTGNGMMNKLLPAGSYSVEVYYTE